MPFLRLLSKPTAPQSALTDPDATLAGVTIFILDTSVGSPALRSRVDPDQSDALEAAVGALTKAGVTVKPLPAVFANKLTSGNNAFDWWSSCMDLEKSTPFAEVITEGVDGWAGQWIPLVQFVAATLGVSTQHSLPAAGSFDLTWVAGWARSLTKVDCCAGLAVVEMANGLMPESYIRGKAAELEEVRFLCTLACGEQCGALTSPLTRPDEKVADKSAWRGRGNSSSDAPHNGLSASRRPDSLLRCCVDVPVQCSRISGNNNSVWLVGNFPTAEGRSVCRSMRCGPPYHRCCFETRASRRSPLGKTILGRTLI